MAGRFLGWSGSIWVVQLSLMSIYHTFVTLLYPGGFSHAAFEPAKTG